MTTELTKFNFEITSLQQAMDYAKLIADSDLAPKDYKGKPGNVLIAIQYGVEIGLKPMQAIQNIAVINGRPAIWGDAMIALVQNHPLCEYITEELKNDTAYCTVKRRGEEEHTSKFSKADAKTAGLLSKPGPWSQYPERMLQMRARAFALRDKFSDVLKGIAMHEEVADYQEADKCTKASMASNKINVLIGEKVENVVCVEDLTNIINSAKNKEDLDNAAELAKSIPEKDKAKVRTLYKNKVNELGKVDKVTGEIIDHPESLPVSFESIKTALEISKNIDALNESADFIRELPAEEQEELNELYRLRKAQLS